MSAACSQYGNKALCRWIFLRRSGSAIYKLTLGSTGRPFLGKGRLRFQPIGENAGTVRVTEAAQNPDSMIEARVTADYSGAYGSQSGILLRVEGGAGSLYLQTGRQPPLPLAQTSETEFFTTALNLHVKFERADDGQMNYCHPCVPHWMEFLGLSARVSS
jgi:hypothetical protein